MKRILLITLLIPIFAHAEVQTHHVIVSDAKSLTPLMTQSPDFVGAAQQGAQEGFAIGQAIKAKREAKKAEQRQAQYATDLIQGTGGLKNISADTILPLIQKYPEKSSELLNMLQSEN